MKFVRFALATVLVALMTMPALAQVGAAPIGQATTVVQSGDLGAQVLQWVLATFGTAIGALLTAVLSRVLQKAGVELNAQRSAKLQDIIVNGLNIAGKEAEQSMRGAGQIEVKNAIVARAVEYAQAHGADTLKALGADPASAKAVEAIKARIETAVNDPITPTPAALDVPAPPAPGTAAMPVSTLPSAAKAV